MYLEEKFLNHYIFNPLTMIHNNNNSKAFVPVSVVDVELLL